MRPITLRTCILWIVLAAGVCLPLSAELSPQFSLADLEAANSFPGSDLTCTLTIRTLQGGREPVDSKVSYFRQQGGDKVLFIVQGPREEVGEGMLRLGGEYYGRTLVDKLPYHVSAKDLTLGLKAMFAGLSVVPWSSVLDLWSTRWTRDFDLAEGREPAVLGKLAVTLLVLKGRGGPGTPAQIRVWVTDDGLIRKREDSTADGRVFFSAVLPGYTSLGASWYPSLILEERADTKERTLFTLGTVSLAPVPPLVFTTDYLLQPRR